MHNIIILVTIGLLLLLSYIIGVKFSPSNKDSKSSFIGASKSFGSIVVALSTMSAIASGWMLVGMPAVVYSNGNAANLNAMMAVGFALSYIFIGKKVRGIAETRQISTIGDLVDARYKDNRVIKFATALVVFIGTFSYLAAQIGAGASLLEYLFGWDKFISSILIFSIVIFYVMKGGESAGIMSQAFQGTIMFIAGVIIISMFFYLGGFGKMTSGVLGGGPGNFKHIQLSAFGTASGGMATTYYILGIIGTVCQPATISRMYAIKNPKEMPKLGLQTGIFQAVVSFLGFTIGYFAILLVSNGMLAPIADPAVTAWEVGKYLGFGFQLLLYTAITAAIISSASTYMTLGAQAFAVDMMSAIGVEHTDKEQISLYQKMIVVVGVVSILVSSFGGNAVAVLGSLGWATFMTIFIPVIVIGFLWKKASIKGVQAAAIVAVIGNILGLLNDNVFKLTLPGGIPWTIYLIALTTIIVIVVSLLTYSEKDDIDPLTQAALEL